MAENTKIQWTRHTMNPWVGCAKVHTGCLHCYAEEMMQNRYGRVEWGPGGTRSKTKTPWLDALKWDRQASEEGEKRKVFCASLADVFELRPDLSEWRRELFELIDKTQSLHWLLLTKRPQNVASMWHSKAVWGTDQHGRYRHIGGETQLTRREFRRENVWIGTSISDQFTADRWGRALLRCRPFAKYLFLSLEPQIGQVNLDRLLETGLIDWVIVGGESKQGKEPARPFNPRWAEVALQSCAMFGVPCFIKQFGSNPVDDEGRSIKLQDSHGGDWDEWTEQYRVRECPEQTAMSVLKNPLDTAPRRA